MLLVFDFKRITALMLTLTIYSSQLMASMTNSDACEPFREWGEYILHKKEIGVSQNDLGGTLDLFFSELVSGRDSRNEYYFLEVIKYMASEIYPSHIVSFDNITAISEAFCITYYHSLRQNTNE